MPDWFSPALMSAHAWREASHERISVAMNAVAYDDPDDIRASSHDELREIRTRWFSGAGVAVVVDVDDGRVVTVWRMGSRP